ncbi:Crp/Fnr family transcriptional regulator [Arcicella rosea]|uniref:CRP-like cAMP-binding protein n=1 Tax=Arcicella rosea TaxID=502909 RepID=A0A841ENA9_9BACT|nr:cyclic nucleotide-binding domain-containing protein [Arcicella rosea]MBB6002889.1 CRP-like cAMP-binding protein [Arcicella rosea]
MNEAEKVILSSGIQLSFKQGDYLYRKGQNPDYVFYIKDGSVELKDGLKKTIVLKNKKYFLGLEEMLLDKDHLYSVKVLEHSIFLIFEKSLIDALIYEHTDIRRYFMMSICNQLEESNTVFE